MPRCEASNAIDLLFFYFLHSPSLNTNCTIALPLSLLSLSLFHSAVNPKARIGEQSAHNEIDFPTIEMNISLPPTVRLQSSALRGLWLNYDHFSDYCSSFQLRHARSQNASKCFNASLPIYRTIYKRKNGLNSWVLNSFQIEIHSKAVHFFKGNQIIA